MLFSATQFLAQQSSPYVIIAATDVNMRESANTSSKLITKLQLGQICKVLQRSAEAEDINVYPTNGENIIEESYWYKISINGQSGWVYGAFAFEIRKVTDMYAPVNWNESAHPNWYNADNRSLSIYNAFTGTEAQMGYRPSFFVLINDEEINSNSKTILLEADQTLEKAFGKRYRGIFSDGGNGYSNIIAGFDESEKLIIAFYRSGGMCEICGQITLLEGSFNATKQNYLMTVKYNKGLH